MASFGRREARPGQAIVTRRGRKLLKVAAYAITVLVIVVYAAFPLYWAIVTSLKTGSALFDAQAWPARPTLANYREVLTDAAFVRSIFNSALVAAVTVLVGAGLAIGAAWALVRSDLHGRRALMLAILAVSMFPQVAVLAGMFEVIGALGLYDNPLGLSLAYLMFTLPFTTWTLAAFMRQLPVELEEAAVVDGAGPLKILRRVLLPLLRPALVTTCLLAFIAAWNEFLFALTFTASDLRRTVPVAIALMSGSSEHELPWGLIMAASVIVTLPLVALVMVFQRRIVSGLTAGAVKG